MIVNVIVFSCVCRYLCMRVVHRVDIFFMMDHRISIVLLLLFLMKTLFCSASNHHSKIQEKKDRKRRRSKGSLVYNRFINLTAT